MYIVALIFVRCSLQPHPKREPEAENSEHSLSLLMTKTLSKAGKVSSQRTTPHLHLDLHCT